MVMNLLSLIHISPVGDGLPGRPAHLHCTGSQKAGARPVCSQGKGGTLSMLRDITIGQYFPGHSFIHKMDPRMKLIAAVLYIIVLFVASRPLGMACLLYTSRCV